MKLIGTLQQAIGKQPNKVGVIKKLREILLNQDNLPK